MSRVVVIGAGLAGLVTANHLAEAGLSVTLLNKGLGGLQLGQGTIDVFGYSPDRVLNPLRTAATVTATHPYAVVGTEAVARGVNYAKALLPDLLVGDPEANYHLPSAVGAVRPTCLAQPSMTAGQLSAGAELVIVGLRRLKDFQPQLVAENLTRTVLPDGGRLRARHVWVDVPARDGEIDSSGLVYARAFDSPQFRTDFAKALIDQLRDDEIVGLPAVLGLIDANAWRDLAGKLGHRVFEIPLPPPSVPGMRLNMALTGHAQSRGVRIIPGVPTVAFTAAGGRITSVTTGAERTYRADGFVLATGGFESGALSVASDGTVRETLFGLPLAGLDQTPLVHGDYWGADQPLFRVGVPIDAQARPIRPDGTPVWSNLWAAGGIVAGASRWRELSGDGIALATAIAASSSVEKELA